MESYLRCIPIIQKLVDNHKLGINLKERMVVLDIHLHVAFLPKGNSEYDFKQSDKRYAAFFDKIASYMNFKLGQMGKKDFIDTDKEPIHFLVTSKDLRYIDDEGNPIPVHMQVQERTILVGFYHKKKVDYKIYQETTNG